ncbi:MFS transporter [Acidipropionibacterium virtanenii]|uniref:Major facilitator superfamily (MFS) profile domain-containing protein n=1 Tax=Acidipropionibacterium virtanenii TaxID=2057246 RepID=A0A344UVS2_9ACTN|nr:MFS transporter [Acidipropionibacterium virtanenii]AXE39370.1 hypothetical protein JS278_02218 [Acidipropionibacterium virtanenii]
MRILRHRVYGCLFAAQVISLLGTGLATVALSLVAYDLAGGRAGLMMGAVLAVKMVAYVVIAPLASAALSRIPRRWVLIGSDALRMVAALGLPFVTRMWQIFVLVFILQAASATFTPTFQAVIPVVLPDEEDYTDALSLSRLATDLESIASPMLAAALLLIVPGSALFFGTAIGFVGSTCLVLASALPTGLGLSHEADGPDPPFGQRARSGVVAFFTSPSLRPILVLNMAVAAAVAFVLVQTVVVVRSDLGLPESWVAVFLGINGAGSMITALCLPRILRRVPERSVMLRAGILLPAGVLAAGLLLPMAGSGRVRIVLAALWFLIGAGWSGVETPMARIIRRAVRADQLPAAFAAQFSLSHACWLISYPLAGLLGQWGLTPAAVVLAVLAAASLVAGRLMWGPVDRPVIEEVRV